MTKTELVFELANQTKLTKQDAEKAIDAMVSAIEQGLQKDGVVKVSGLGTFKVSARAARTGRNPQTGKEIEIPAQKSVKFSVSKILKEAVN